MITNINAADQTIKHSTCYACGQILHSYSMLVCAECLDNECEKFASLASSATSSTARKQKKVK